MLLLANQDQLNTALQSYRNIDIKIEVLDYDMYVVDEISGLVESANFNIDADSDIRRTCNVTMQLRDDLSNDPLYSSAFWEVGNPYWFDKYLKINLGIEDIVNGGWVWSNQGIYLINQPSVTYNTTDNTLSFQAVDLMSKVTGMRSGVMTGLDNTIPVGTNIKEVLISLLAEQGFNNYVIFDPPQSVTPYEINISAGGTTYDLMSQLRDINQGWEMFFDVDGVFYFQEIPNEDTLKDKIVTPYIDNDTLQSLSISYQLDTSFEDVKNYIEVYGDYIEPNYVGTQTYNNTVTFELDPLTFRSPAIVGIPFGNLAMPPAKAEDTTYYLYVNMGSWGRKYIELPIEYINCDYRARVTYGSGNVTVEFLGYAQPFAVAWEDNPASPYYVGEKVNESSVTVTPTSALDLMNDPLPRFNKQVREVLSSGDYGNLYTNEMCRACAKYELYKKARRHDNIQITVVPIYWLEANQLIEYRLPNEKQTSYWLIKSISTDFGVAGTQTITATRQYI